MSKRYWTDRRIGTAARVAYIQAAFEIGYGDTPEEPWLDETLTKHMMKILDRWKIPLPPEIARQPTIASGTAPTTDNK